MQAGYHAPGAAEVEAAAAAAAAATGAGTAATRRATKKAAAAAAAAVASGGIRSCAGVLMELDERDVVIPASTAHEMGVMLSFLVYVWRTWR